MKINYNRLQKLANIKPYNTVAIRKKKKLNESIKDKDIEARNDELYAKLVPNSGNTGTTEGEIMRAVNRIGYRYYNDGDMFSKGYGAETAGPAAAYLMDHTPGDYRATASRILRRMENEAAYDREDAYESAFNELLKYTVEYVESKNGNYRPDTTDMLSIDSKWEESYDDDEGNEYDEFEDEDNDY